MGWLTEKATKAADAITERALEARADSAEELPGGGRAYVFDAPTPREIRRAGNDEPGGRR